MEASAATVTDDDMLFVCDCILSRGGESGVQAYDFTAEGAVTAASGARTHLLSVRPKTTFNGITNRTEVSLVGVDLVVTGSSPVMWELCIGQALAAPTYADVNTTYSAMESVSAATLSGSPGLVAARGYCTASAQVKGAVESSIRSKYPITLNAAGAQRDMGTVTLLVTGLGGTSACRGSIQWFEAR